ncbi:hypothetical protein OC834_005224 [Tilletia horrida]|uniref:C2H2-type domain-containing protein n=1 Tax=Tilletia horrida TaxID=155126 RepID=A0AAN6JN71_9BASI|nr:hypothetical protein OC834_005224 [Tilletia horrida]KAK0540664.1 hypothetical protein OC842_000339 [Tilletia horrida]
MAPTSSAAHSVAVSHPPTAPGFAAWENANGAARPHTADGMFPHGADLASGSSTSSSAGGPPTANTDLNSVHAGHVHPHAHPHLHAHTQGNNLTPQRPPLMSNYSSGSGRMFAYMPTSSSDEFTSSGYGSFDSSYSPYQAPDTASTSHLTSNSTNGPTSANSGHRSSSASTNTAASSVEGTHSIGVTITPATKKRPRRRYDEIERMYPCNWPGCTKSYGTLNHLNAHVAMQKHGAKRLPHEFKEMRKQWRKTKRDEEQRRQSTSRIPTGAAGPIPGGPLLPGVTLGNGGPPGSSGGPSTPATEDPYFRGTRMDSFSSAPGGYAGEAGGGGYYAGHSAAYYPPPNGSYGGPRGSTSSVYSYATAPPGSSSAAPGGPQQPGNGHWVTPYGAQQASSAANGAPNGNGSAGHMFPPPSGPARSYSMSAASATAPMPPNGAAWSNQGHAYASAPPPPYGGGGGGGGGGYPQSAHGYATGGAGSHGGYGGGAYAGAYGNGNGGMSAPSTSAGTGSANGAGVGSVSGTHGVPPSSNSSAAAAAAAGGLGAYLMAHRGSI